MPRSDHPISRQHIDADALKSVPAPAVRPMRTRRRQCSGLLLGRTPKDFDIVRRLTRTGSSAFSGMLVSAAVSAAHVKFGLKCIEVATFRRRFPGHEEEPAPAPLCLPPRARHATIRLADSSRQHIRHARRRRVSPRLHAERALLRHRDAIHHRLCRRARGHSRRAHQMHRRSGGAVSGRSRAHAARRRAGSAPRFQNRRPDSAGDRPLSRRARTQRARPRRNLQSGEPGAEKPADAVEKGLLAATPEVLAHYRKFWQSLASTAPSRRAFKRNRSLAKRYSRSLLIPLGLWTSITVAR